MLKSELEKILAGADLTADEEPLPCKVSVLGILHAISGQLLRLLAGQPGFLSYGGIR